MFQGLKPLAESLGPFGTNLRSVAIESTFRARARDNFLTKRSRPNIDQSSVRESIGSTPPSRLRVCGSVLRDPTSVRVPLPYARSRFRSGGCRGRFHPWRAPRRVALENRAGKCLG